VAAEGALQSKKLVDLLQPAGRLRAVTWIVAITASVLVRALPLCAGSPYIAYVDEGNFLHPAFKMVRDRTWDPHEYLYPQFPRMAAAAASIAVDAFARLGGGGSLRDRIPRTVEAYDELEPFAFLLAARTLSAAAGIITILLTGLLAERLVSGSGAAAALIAALVPALALRGSIATVDPYATVAVLACLYVTDRMRKAARPELAALVAGAFVGLAFASKYPSVLVFAAFGTTTLLLPTRSSEKAARLLAGIVGALLGALLAMPALWRHPAEVFAGLAEQRHLYGQFAADTSLWSQALVRAESDLNFEGPEVGIVFVALVVLGVAVGFFRRDLVPTMTGWCAFAVLSFVLYGSQRYRPFRNLMPLVSVGCVAAAIGYKWIRDRFQRTLWFDALGAALLLVLFAVPMARHVRERRDLVDPRRRVIDWLASRSRSGDQTAYLHDLAILHGELARLPGEHWPVSSSDADAMIRARSPRFVIAGVLAPPAGPFVDLTALPILRSDYEPVLRVGAKPTIPIAWWWHGNDQIVAILERRDSPR
jgi:hypothetical protein